MSGVLKKTTRLTGLKVATHPHHTLNVYYKKTLQILENFPKDYPYRQHTEKLVKERMNVLNSNTNISTIEDKIGCGQIEEVIIQAENEYNLVKRFQECKPWEPLIQEAPASQWAWPPHK